MGAVLPADASAALIINGGLAREKKSWEKEYTNETVFTQNRGGWGLGGDRIEL